MNPMRLNLRSAERHGSLVRTSREVSDLLAFAHCAHGFQTDSDVRDECEHNAEKPKICSCGLCAQPGHGRPAIPSFGRGNPMPPNCSSSPEAMRTKPKSPSHRGLDELTMSRRLVRLFAGPVAAAGIIGGAMAIWAIAYAGSAPMALTPAQPSVASHAVQQPIVAQHSSRAVETAPWPPSSLVVSASAPLLGAPASHMLGDR